MREKARYCRVGTNAFALVIISGSLYTADALVHVPLNRLRQICANAQNFAMPANKMGTDVMASAVQYAVQRARACVCV